MNKPAMDNSELPNNNNNSYQQQQQQQQASFGSRGNNRSAGMNLQAPGFTAAPFPSADSMTNADLRRYSLSVAPGLSVEQQQQQQQMSALQQHQNMMSASQHHAMNLRPEGLQQQQPQNPHAGMMPSFGIPDMSPTMVQRMHSMAQGGSSSNMFMPGPPSMNPNFPAANQQQRDLDARFGPQGGQPHPLSSAQADREEELLVNLLIARRQRGQMSAESSGNAQALADELIRLRQSRAAAAAGMSLNQGLPLYSESASLPQQQQQQPGNVSLGQQQKLLMDHYRNKPTDPNSLNLVAAQEMNERIDRSPTRFMDARSQQEMLDLSARGGGMRSRVADAMAMGIKYGNTTTTGAIMEPHGMFGSVSGGFAPDLVGPPVKKKKRTHKKKPADMPRRPLSAYNLFFSEERERILKEIEEKEGKTEGGDTTKAAEEETTTTPKEDEDASKPKALLRPLIPAQKKRRPHRKTHGKISFQQLARMVGERWKNLPDERRKKYQDLAQEDMKRQKQAMEEYYAKQNAAKLAMAKDATKGAEKEESAAGKETDTKGDGITGA